jgi:preprotein translocase SecE subunit
MAISRRKNDSIVETQIGDKQVETKKSELNLKKPEQKKGFLRSTLYELTKVEWPSMQYTVRWSAFIILFTIFISLFLGYVDQVFTSGITFIDCTKPLVTDDKGDNLLQKCTTDFFNDVTFRGN